MPREIVRTGTITARLTIRLVERSDLPSLLACSAARASEAGQWVGRRGPAVRAATRCLAGSHAVRLAGFEEPCPDRRLRASRCWPCSACSWACTISCRLPHALEFDTLRGEVQVHATRDAADKTDVRQLTPAGSAAKPAGVATAASSASDARLANVVAPMRQPGNPASRRCRWPMRTCCRTTRP